MSGTVIPKHIFVLVIVIAAITAVAAAVPFIVGGGPGPSEHISVRGESVVLFGYGLYQHMPADVAVQGLAQDLVTLAIAVPLLLLSLSMARRRSDVGYFLLTGTIGYLFVQYTLYLAMAMYNALFLVWVALVLLLFQVLVRLLLIGARDRIWPSPTPAVRRYVGGFLIANGALIGLLWLSLIVPPILDGTLYPPGLAHFTTMIVQGFDLALFLPPSLLAGFYYLRARKAGDLMAPVYSVFLSIQMVALLAKIVWMAATGASAGPALVIIPLLPLGAVASAYLSLKPHAAR
jgi:hypothetical protein